MLAVGREMGLAVPTGMEGRCHGLGWGHLTAERRQQPLQEQERSQQGKQGSAVTKETAATAVHRQVTPARGVGHGRGVRNATAAGTASPREDQLCHRTKINIKCAQSACARICW